MICPICQKPMPGNMLEQDVFLLHFRNSQCKTSAFQDEALDLTPVMPTDLLLTVLVCRRLKTLKQLFITQQRNSQFKKAFEIVFPQDIVKITDSSVNELSQHAETKFQKQSGELDRKQKITVVTIPSKAPINDALLQVPFENLESSLLAIHVLKRDGVPQEKTYLLDLDVFLGSHGLYMRNEYFKSSILLDPTETTAKKADESDSDLRIEELNSFRNTRSQSNLSFVTCQLQEVKDESASSMLNMSPESDEKMKQLDEFNSKEMIQQIRNKVVKIVNDSVNIFNQYIMAKPTQEVAIFDEIQRAIALVAKRRFSSVLARPDLEQILMALLPNLEQIDGVKITNEMRQKALKHCFDNYSVPHEQFLPTIRKPTERTLVTQLLKSIGIQQQSLTIQKVGSLKSAVCIMKSLQIDPQFPLQNQSNYVSRCIQSVQSAKAKVFQKTTFPKIIKISDASDTYSKTQNQKIFVKTAMKNAGSYCILHHYDDLMLCGSTNGYVTAYHPLLPYLDQVEEFSATTADYEAVPSFPQFQIPSAQSNSYKRRICALTHINEQVLMLSQEGQMCLSAFRNFEERSNRFEKLVKLKFQPTGMDVRGSMVLAYGLNEFLLCDVHSGAVSTHFVHQPVSLLQQYQEQILLCPLQGGMVLLDNRMREVVKLCSTAFPICSLQLAKHRIAGASLDSAVFSLDIRQPSDIVCKQFSRIAQVDNAPILRSVSDSKILVSHPLTGVVRILDRVNLQLQNEFQLGMLGGQLGAVEPASKYDFSFVMIDGGISEVCTLMSMEQ